MDWNWFFSSLAQSGAALIGIIAAFVISKLLTESQKLEKHQSGLAKLKAQYTDLKKQIDLLDIGVYNEDMIYSSLELRYLIANDHIFDNKSAEQNEEELYIRMPMLCRHQRNKVIFEQFYQKCKNGAMPIPSKAKDIYIFKNRMWIEMEHHHKELRDKHVEIEKRRIEVDSLINYFHISKDELSWIGKGYTQFKWVLKILILGVLFTVVYPLSFLPVDVNRNPAVSINPATMWSNIWSLQGWMLFLLLLFVEGIFVYFLWQLRKMTYTRKFLLDSITDKYLSLSGYSEYFS